MREVAGGWISGAVGPGDKPLGSLGCGLLMDAFRSDLRWEPWFGLQFLNLRRMQRQELPNLRGVSRPGIAAELRLNNRPLACRCLSWAVAKLRTKESVMSVPAGEASLLAEIDLRQDEVLRQLDELNARLEQVLTEYNPARPADLLSRAA